MPADHDDLTPSVDEPDAELAWRWVFRVVRAWLGWVFIGLGALLVALGWYGVSGEATVEDQIPYLVSGGIGGILLAIVGAALAATEELRKSSGRLDRIEAKVADLHDVLLSRPDAPTSPPAGPGGNGTVDAAVLAVRGGETFHRRGCAMVTGKDAEELTADAARDRGLSPCRLCEPASV